MLSETRISNRLTNKRIMAFLCGALAAFLLLLAVHLRGWSSTTNPETYSGTWINKVSTTSGITKIEISPANGVFVAQAWGACRPQDCNWGKATPRFSRNDAKIVWELGAIRVSVALKIKGDRMVVKTNHDFSDGRAQSQEVDDFARQQ